MKNLPPGLFISFFISASLFPGCSSRNQAPPENDIKSLDLKQGNVVLCGPSNKQLGEVHFVTSCNDNLKPEMDLAIALLHSFEYDEAEKVFAKIIGQAPDCAMAYWGVAMANYHQVWPSPPTPAEIEKGSKAILIAKSIRGSELETEYINAIAEFYHGWKLTEHWTQSKKYKDAMAKMYKKYPDDKEVAIFYSLALVASADPADKSYEQQRKAGNVLMELYKKEPDHPGIVHYIIHSYDYPELASLALPAAQKYAMIAPSSSHALHMPSHIFTRLGMWDECIESNLASIEAAKCYAENAGIKGHWDEELHGMDYVVYGYLQKGLNKKAKKQRDYLNTIRDVYPANFKVAYAYAAIPCRYVLENRMWKEASEIPLNPDNFDWKAFPWQMSIVHFTRVLGSAHTGDLKKAKRELEQLGLRMQELTAINDQYKANQVMIQMKMGEAWILFAEGKTKEAVETMKIAADMEAKTEKSPVTPAEVLPASELLADMLLALNQPQEALKYYEDDLTQHPNRFNGVYGAAKACESSGNTEKAKIYFATLTKIADQPGSDRAELLEARTYLKNH